MKDLLSLCGLQCVIWRKAWEKISRLDTFSRGRRAIQDVLHLGRWDVFSDFPIVNNPRIEAKPCCKGRQFTFKKTIHDVVNYIHKTSITTKCGVVNHKKWSNEPQNKFLL